VPTSGKPPHSSGGAAEERGGAVIVSGILFIASLATINLTHHSLFIVAILLDCVLIDVMLLQRAEKHGFRL
jgi:hypothetical protein